MAELTARYNLRSSATLRKKPIGSTVLTISYWQDALAAAEENPVAMASMICTGDLLIVMVIVADPSYSRL
ncbi:MAG: hypothetical protein ACLRPV_04440 [Lacrimispora saccharolytica]